MKNIKSLVMIGLLSASMLVSVGCQNTNDVIYESDVMKITLENEFVDIKELEGNYGYSYKDVLCEYVADVTVENKIEEDFNLKKGTRSFLWKKDLVPFSVFVD